MAETLAKLKILNQNVKIYFALNEESIEMENAAIWKDTIKQLSVATSDIQGMVAALFEFTQSLYSELYQNFE